MLQLKLNNMDTLLVIALIVILLLAFVFFIIGSYKNASKSIHDLNDKYERYLKEKNDQNMKIGNSNSNVTRHATH